VRGPEKLATRVASPRLRKCEMLNVLLAYLAGHVVVLIVAIAFYKLLRHEPALAARRGAIFELTSKSARIEAGQREAAAARAELCILQQRGDRLHEKIDSLVRLDDPPSTVLGFYLAAIILAEGEALLILLLCGSARLGGLSFAAWAFASAPGASVALVLVHILLGILLADHDRPARTVRRAKAGAGVCLTAVLIGVAMTFSGRSMSDLALVAQLAGMGLIALSTLISLTAGFCSIIATTVYEAHSQERELAHLDQRRNAYEHHIQMIERDLARVQGSPGPPPTAASAVPAGILPALLVTAALLGLPAAGHTQATTAFPPTARAASIHPTGSVFDRAGACELLVDVTSSVDRSEADQAPFQSTVTEVSGMVPLIADAFECRIVRVTPFAGDLFVNITELSIPAPSNPVRACRAALSAPTNAIQQAVIRLYPAVDTARQTRERQGCLTRRRLARERAAAARSAALKQVENTLQATTTLAPRGPCTALPQAVQRALLRSRNVIVITDGVPTCTRPGDPTRVPPASRLLFLVVPSGDVGSLDRANLLLDRLAALDHLFPGAHAILAPEATPSFWRHLSR